MHEDGFCRKALPNRLFKVLCFEVHMSTWRRKALEFLPQFRIDIESSNNVTYLWVEISARFSNAVENSEEDFIDGTFKYLIWCLSGVAGQEAEQAVYCGFLEDIVAEKKQWKHFSTWFTKGQFESYKSIFKYRLSDVDFKQLEDVFYGR